MVNSALWKKVESFDLDKPLSEYGFSVRLAKENCWTTNFTAGAILEYKKFMFLAATSEFMISPSEIVDVVWHQHLVFTQSYAELCNILGRKIEHIPSTRNKEDFTKFKLAKERTTQYYTEVFGLQPPTFWNYSDINEPLALEKAKLKVRTVLLFAVFAWLVLWIPAFFILRPIYITLDSSYFLTGYFMLAVAAFAVLEFFNRERLNAVVKDWDRNAFAFNLSAMELVYMKHGSIDRVIHGYVNHMVDEGEIEVEKHNRLKLAKHFATNDPVEHMIAEAVKSSGDHGYKVLITQLKLKPIFTNIALSAEGFKKYIIKSQMFSRLFFINFTVLGLLLMGGTVRLVTGIMRERPVSILVVLLAALAGITVAYLIRLSNLMTSEIVPGFYSDEIVAQKPDGRNWDWDYFILGTAVLTTAFMPVYRDFTGTTSGGGGGGDSSGSGCGSGCGSSCGGGCGGCGGG